MKPIRRSEILALLGLASIAAGHLLFPLVRRMYVQQTPSGERYVTNLTGGAWVVTLGWWLGLVLMITALVFAGRERRRGE